MAKKIGVLACKKVGASCARVGCFTAFNERVKGFEQYKDEDVLMAAYMDCGGCDCDRATDPGFLRKMTKIKDNNIEVIHLSNCVAHDCEHVEEIKKALTDNGICFVEGTH